MFDFQPLPDATTPPELPDWQAPAHPILMGLAGLALAVIGWQGLLWQSTRPHFDESTGEVTGQVDELATGPESLIRVVRAADPVPAAPPAPSSKPPSAQELPTRRPAVGALGSPTATAPDSPGSDPGLSPFRRTHPWAAAPGQPYYYPSRCPATLRFPDLMFFRTQREARANGFVPAPDSGCG